FHATEPGDRAAGHGGDPRHGQEDPASGGDCEITPGTQDFNMNLSTIRAPKKASEKKKRVGRGMGSGMGKTSTRGHKGQWSRSGARLIRGFEGGQMPLHRRIPKRGFTNIFREEYDVVNLDRLATLGETEITPDVLKKAGVVNGKQ